MLTAKPDTTDVVHNPQVSVWKVRSYRLYWIGIFVTFMGNWIQNVALGWYVYQLTNSQFLLGLVPFLAQMPITLFGLFGGVIADRFERRRLVMVTASMNLVLNGIMAWLALTGQLQFWHLVVVAILGGFILMADGPARQAMVMDLLGADQMPIGIAMNSVAFNISRIAGPVVGAAIMVKHGAGMCFAVNAVSYFVLIYMMTIITVNSQRNLSLHGSALSEVGAALRMIADNGLMKALLSLDAVICLFGLSYVALLPVYAKDTYKLGPDGFGTMYSATGIGALIGALLLSRLVGRVPRGISLIITSSILCVGLIIFNGASMWPNMVAYSIALVGLSLVGCGMVSTLASNNSLMQLLAPPEMTGRAASLHIYAMSGIGPFGSLIAGWLACRYCAPVAVWICIAFCIVAVVMISLRRDIRQLGVY